MTDDRRVPLAGSVRDMVRAIPKPPPAWTWRLGTIAALTAPTVTVTLDGKNVTGVRTLSGYGPAVADDVWVLVAPDGVPIFATGTAPMAGQLLVPNGSAAAPALAFASDTDTGVYRIQANDMGVSVGGSLKLRLTTGTCILDAALLPQVDDTYDLGSSALRWDDVWATNGTIQTSDGAVKEDVETLTTSQALAALGALAQAAITFRFADGTRKHSGFDAAQVGQALQDRSAAYIDPAAGAVAPDRADYADDDADDDAYAEAQAEYEALLAAPKGLRYAEIIPWLTVALNAAVNRGLQLQQQLADLTGRVETLEAGG